jgi:hypothetical protein
MTRARTPIVLLVLVQLLCAHRGLSCIESTVGRDYIFIGSVCRHMGDECHTLDTNGEWYQVIDLTGRVVAGGRHGSPVAVLRRLGLDVLLHGSLPVENVGPRP